MKFSMSPLCEICGKHRSKFDHSGCSKLKQKLFIGTHKSKPLKHNTAYADDKKLDTFLKTVGE